jgi:hypothetical protein
MSWNKFADNSLRALLEYLARHCKSTRLRVFLPEFLIQVKTRKKIEMKLWLDLLYAKKQTNNVWLYLDKIYIHPPVGELIRYYDLIKRI